MEMPAPLKEKYNKMKQDLVYYAGTLDMDCNKLAEDATKYADEHAKKDEFEIYQGEIKTLRELTAFARPIVEKIDKQLKNGTYRIELINLQVNKYGDMYDKRIKRVKHISESCADKLTEIQTNHWLDEWD